VAALEGNMNRILTAVLISFATIAGSAQNDINHAAQFQIDWRHTRWIDSTLRSIQKVKVGMERFELLEVFTEEGGIATTSQRTYVYRQCPLIKVEVEFAASSRDKELPTDKIVKISRPYLEWAHTD
jgi:hypothetical protein